MARIRSIKPEFFRHEALFEAERETGLPLRLAFAGLWTVADREGRFKWRPRAMKLDVLPYDDVDFAAVLDQLADRGFVIRYEVGGAVFGAIPSWSSHQIINNRESASVLPAPPIDACPTRGPHVADTTATPDEIPPDATTTPLVLAQVEGKGMEWKGVEGRATRASAADRGSRLPSDWTLPTDWKAWAEAERLDIDVEATAASFADHWHAEPGAKGRKADWLATWRKWVRNQRAPANAGPANRSRPNPMHADEQFA